MEAGSWVRVGTLSSDLWQQNEDGSYPQAMIEIEDRGKYEIRTPIDGQPDFGDALGEVIHVSEDGQTIAVRFSPALQRVCKDLWWLFRPEDVVRATPTDDEQFQYVMDWWE